MNQYRSNIFLMEAAEKARVIKLGNSTIRLQGKSLFALIVAGALIFIIFLYKLMPSDGLYRRNPRFPMGDPLDPYFFPELPYNATYPLTHPVKLEGGWIKYRIALVADMDLKAKVEGKEEWMSYLKYGDILWNPEFKEIKVEWEREPAGLIKLVSSWAYGNRGMEMSELVVFNGRLYGVDDRTGVVYEIEGNLAIPWVILTDGNGRATKGFKSEWATVKDQHLFVGGFGKEWTSPTGELINDNPLWIKRISTDGRVQHFSWKKNFLAIREKLNIQFPGYVIHETGGWSEKHRKWVFLPRRVSKDKYDEKLDEHMGANHMLVAEENFSAIDDILVGEVSPTHGFSSFKFLPDSGDNIIVALKSEEDDGNISSYIMAFDLTGKILLPETLIVKNIKFEGVEFI
ncbi:soluble calcium-activated nucleotidase 1-like [Paramacrobiotus metropolitanus]|uniref:soluble calcium-activated nucleotidase 1-like n=1 Tax=Paramacrobiotus metropolitanus TaxID=2943436 RepID=UPI0024457EC4|nr:soluble calcium-activated nucleotidase 1-like [Paramacrobiotus metropolitanus]